MIIDIHTSLLLQVSFFGQVITILHFFSHLLRVASGRIPGSINGPLNMSCNAILACIELGTNNTLAAQRSTNLLPNLSDSSVGVELLANSTSR